MGEPEVSDRSSSSDPLYNLYARYIGEPRSKTDVYGYWVFIVGYLLGVAGIAAFLAETSMAGPTRFAVREASFVLSALGLPLALLGIVLMLPVRRRGVQAAILGAVLAVVGAAGFSTLYPADWGGTATGAGLSIISVYGAGVAIVAGVAALVPVVTGQRSAFYESETEIEPTAEQSEVLLGESLRGALFAVFNDDGEWAWRMIQEEAMADSPDRYMTRLETEDWVDELKEQIAAAGMLEIRGAAFRLYEVGDGGWRWVLMREDGGVVADGGDEFSTRDAAEESVNLLKEHGPDAELLSVDGAAFDYYRDDGGWRWRLLDEGRNELAAGTEAYSDHGAAVETVDSVKEGVEGANVLSIDRFGVELLEREEGWEWHLLDADEFQIAAGEGTYESRKAVETAANDVLDGIESAPVVEAGRPLYEVVPDGPNAWRWRLVDAGTDVVARGHEEASTPAEAEEGATRMKSNAGDATVFEIDGTAFEMYADGAQWRWRFVDEDRNLIAVGDEGYGDRETADEAIQRIREQVVEAELIEFDEAAFQLYEAGEGEWRWRLISEDGDVMADSGEDFFSRDQAASSMNTLKQYAPDAELLEIDTAAFELYQTDEEWYWRLIDETGDLIARAGEGYPSRQAARLAMDRLVENAPEADLRAMEAAGFQLYPDDEDDWRWRFVLPDGDIVADSAEEYTTRDQAAAGVDDLRPDAVEAAVETIESMAITAIESDGSWRWQVVDVDREPLATSARVHEDRDGLVEELRAIRRHAASTIVFDIDGFVFRLRETDDGWRWRLIDEDRNALAVGAGTYGSEEDARRVIDMVRRLAPEAGSIDYETAAFEAFRDGDGWRWRLIDEDEHVIAASTNAHDARDGAVDELEAIKGIVDDASILEIDTAAFELHEDDEEGGWRWRLVDANGDVIGRSVSTYPSRGGAREAMRTVKEFGPTARIAVAEYE